MTNFGTSIFLEAVHDCTCDGVLGCLVVSLLLRTDTTDILTGLERIVLWRVRPDEK